MDQVNSANEKWTRVRPGVGVLCGTIAGVLVPNSLQVGLAFYFPESSEWGLLFWGEHWVLRPLASVFAAFCAAAVAGAIARRQGELVGVLAVFPSAVIWAVAAISGWMGHLPFDDSVLYVSIGNRVAATLTPFMLVPIGRAAGGEGERFGAMYAEHFDSRRWTLLGVRWFHFAWLPVLIHLLLVQFAWAGYYGLEWLKVTWRSGANYYTAMLPMLFLVGLWGTLALVGQGATTAYHVLAGIESRSSTSERVVAVIKNGVGLPTLALIAQAAIMAVHYGILRWLE